MTHNGMRIGQLAAALGTTTKTLRFYERIALLQPPVRSDSGYRLYDRAAMDRARLVIGLRRLDFSIDEVRELLANDGVMTTRQRLLALMDEKLREMYLQLGVLQGRCEDLAARHEAMLSAPRDRPANCICDAMLRACTCAETPPKKRAGTGSSRARG